MARKTQRVALARFQELTGCSAGELRLIRNSQWSGYRADDASVDLAASRVVLAALRQARV